MVTKLLYIVVKWQVRQQIIAEIEASVFCKLMTTVAELK
jgi:hypothetical protein